VARDAIARQFDVEKNTVRLTIEPGATGNYQPGTIAFFAKKGKSVDVNKMRESIKATRLSGGTSMEVTYLEITATGAVSVAGTETVLEVAGTGQQFLLLDDAGPAAKEGVQTAFQRLRQALDRGEKVVQVTGRVQGWTGRFPKVLRELSQEAEGPAPRRMGLTVGDFQTAKQQGSRER
jgi:hypothetical protein